MTDCPLCDPGYEDEHDGRVRHQTILDWIDYWKGEAGWKRKQALWAAKRLSRATLAEKKKPAV